MDFMPSIRAWTILKKGGDTLDAAVAVVTVVEDDPNDDSVGYGGLPNEEETWSLDASVMHRAHAPRRLGGERAPYQERFAPGEDGDGENQSRHGRWVTARVVLRSRKASRR